MEEWKEYIISEVIEEIAMGPFGSNIKVDNFIDFGIPVLNGSNLQGFKLNENSFNYLSEEKADSLGRANAYRGDVVITHRGTLGQIVYIPSNSKYNRYVISQSQFRLKLNQTLIRPDFFVYFFHTRIGQHRLLMNASQVGVPALARPTSTFKEVSVPVPPMEVQDKVMAILHSLDDKIEVNRKINENLEQQAQALFKSWFVDFEPFKDGEFVESELGMIPKGWRVGLFGELMNISSGKRPAKKSSTSTSDFIIPLIGASEVMGYTNSILYQNRILVIGRVGTHGIVQRFNEPCWPSDNTLVITSDFYEYCCQVLLKIDYQSLNRGSTQPLITQTDIKNQVIIIPDIKTLNLYEEKVGCIMQLREHNLNESRRLAELRDTLLPKLMSGELKVNEIA